MRTLCITLLLATSLSAAETLKIERGPTKEPTYQHKPAYGMLAFGPEGKNRIWLVRDGDRLYVDKNGNGDLTDDGGPVLREPPRMGQEQEKLLFQVGDITVAGKTHKRLAVEATRLAALKTTLKPSDYPVYLSRNPLIAGALKNDPEACTYMIGCLVETPGLQGAGIGGRLEMFAGPKDTKGLLQFSNKATSAPIIHLGGPLEIHFAKEYPSLAAGRKQEWELVVGTSGTGPGTFATMEHEEVIPAAAHPKVEIAYAAKSRGAKPFKEVFEIKERCCIVLFHDGVSVSPKATETATITLSFDAWKKGNVKPTTHTLKIAGGK